MDDDTREVLAYIFGIKRKPRIDTEKLADEIREEVRKEFEKHKPELDEAIDNLIDAIQLNESRSI